MIKYKQDDLKETVVIDKLKQFLPSQPPLKDFIFQNLLAGFQDEKFHDALQKNSCIFGYKNYLKLDQFRSLYTSGQISEESIKNAFEERNLIGDYTLWKYRLFEQEFQETITARIGVVREHWKQHFRIDLDSLVHPTLFRVVCSYLDQGISIWNFPAGNKGFLSSIQELEKNSFTSFFKHKRAKELLLSGNYSIEYLLEILVGKKEDYEHYLFDQQFAHPGWSGIVASIEMNPGTLLDTRSISLMEFIQFELLLEIDALDSYFSDIWSPLSHKLNKSYTGIFDEVEHSTYFEVLSIFQEAYEWSYYNNVIKGLCSTENQETESSQASSFQAVFCIDDRECSLRRYIEHVDTKAETFGTPGHFNLEFYFQPEHSKFYTKVCPSPITPTFIIKELENKRKKNKKDISFSKSSSGLVQGLILSLTFGFLSIFKLIGSIFKPYKTSSFVTSFKHMNPDSILTIENKEGAKTKEGLQIGFTVSEMSERFFSLLMSIGLTDNFSEVVYFIGHGSSSSNNPFYTTMDCGACSCKPGSVNARVISAIGNDKRVRENLANRGIIIPESTTFIGGLHDTARDEIMFYDTSNLSQSIMSKHQDHLQVFQKSLALNAKERSRRFYSINSMGPIEKVHKKIKLRTVSLFEPRPELDHATATLCIVGRRNLTRNVFLDRRAFLNSYTYSLDPKGEFLAGILNAATPVCGGINLNYYFSKVDNHNFGSGTKLPHNVMGLFGVSNGIDGDLRPGLPNQMIELHDPLRLLMVVEHEPSVVNHVILSNPATYQWYLNNWINLIVIHPVTKIVYRFVNEQFEVYEHFLNRSIEKLQDYESLIDNSGQNLPVLILN